MRFASLSLERFGPFEGRTLAFDPARRLHVVYGPNEAGKTCALAAVEGLLYGIEERTPHAFRVRMDELRLGAELIARDGRRLAVRRRKGRRGTLVDADDRPIGDDLLVPFLSGVSRETFRDAFGLSQEGLRSGAAAMLAAHGEVGRSLFAAASGLTALVQVTEALASEADELFKPRGRDQAFPQALERYDEARLALRDGALPWKTWQGLREREGALAAEAATLAEAQRALDAERSRLERVRRTAPVVARLDGVAAELARLADLPEAPDDLPDRVDAALRAREDTARAGRELAGRIAALDARLGEPLDAAPLAEAAAIAQLVEGRTAFREAMRDIPKREEEAREARAQLADVARRLDLPGVDALRARVPAAADIARLRRLADDGQRLETAMRLLEQDRRAAEAALADAERARLRTPPAQDPEALRRRFAALEPVLDALKPRGELAAALARRQGQLAERARRLLPPVGDLDALAGRPLPARADLDGVAAALRAVETRRDELARRRAELAAAAEEAEAALARLAAGGDLVTEDRIAEARRARDGLWAVARAVVIDGEVPGLDGPARRALAHDLDRALPAADALADARTRDAERAARHAEASGRLAAAQAALTGLAEAEAANRAQHREAAARWAALWADAGVAPGEPAAMAAWLDRLQTLFAERDDLAELATRIAGIDATAADAGPAMARLAADLGVSTGDGPLLVLRAIAAAIDGQQAKWQAVRDAMRAVADATDRRDDVARRLREEAARTEAWRGRWQGAVGLVGAAADAGIDEALRRLEDWASVPAVADRLDTAERRLAAMAADTAAYRAAAEALAGRLAADLTGRAALDIVDAMRARLDAAKAAAAARDRDRAERAELADRLAATERDQREADTALAALAGGADAAAFALRLRSRGDLRARARDLRDELLGAGDGLDEAALRADARAVAIDAVMARLAALPEAREQLATRLRALDIELAEPRRELAHAGTRQDAETAAQRQASAAAELEDIARRWAVRVAARTLAREALARHRARYQDPLVVRASMLFAKLAGGAFAGLDVAYDEDGAGRLAGRRPDGEKVKVEGMSEGTRDQLYLALRLAALDAFAREADPLPFIGDDLLVSFDDDRLVHALEVLAETGRQTQVLLFTHHRHVAAAAERLGAAAEVVAL